MDRITKPALYAQAGIPHYWRIEMDGGLVVHTFRIDPVDEVYAETGGAYLCSRLRGSQTRLTPRAHGWTKFVDTGEPWPINLPISRLTPRHLYPAAASPRRAAGAARTAR